MTYDDRPQPAIRLEQARKARGFQRASDASDYFGWKYDTYIQHERGVNGLSRAVKQYARAYNVSVGWLLNGEGPGPGENAALAPSVPVISWVSAGGLDDDGLIDEPIGAINVANLPHGNWIALEVDGDSMDRISPPGSIILVNRAETQLTPNACYVIANDDGRATYKRYRPSPDRFEPVSTNPAHEPFFIDNCDHMPAIIGRVRMSILSM
jgi:phage repressor protein C with HTH and peptisase S24 domain